MGLGGQAETLGERGYAMAALLVALAVMAILLTVAMPVWRHEAQREKEAELIFRGEQYARAIALYRAKNGNMLPPSFDVLVQGRYLRKKYKDPMTKDGEFLPIAMAQNAGGVSQPGPGRGGTRGAPGMVPPPQPIGTPSVPPQSGGPGIAIGGIQGVRSKSEENSIRSYRGATRYDQWAFLANNVQRPGGMPMGNQSQTPGQIGGRGPNRGNTPNRPGGTPTTPGTGAPAGGRGPGRGGRGGGF
jgi:type II secretory pathway pseudopilin PulG